MKIMISIRPYLPESIKPKAIVMREWEDPEGKHLQILIHPGKWIDTAPSAILEDDQTFEVTR